MFHEIISHCQQFPTFQNPFVHIAQHTEKFLIHYSLLRHCFVHFHQSSLLPKIKNPYKFQEKSSNYDETKLFYVNVLSK